PLPAAGGPPPPPPAAPPQFEDRTTGSGVAFTYRNGEEADQYTMLETLGGGVALLDYDGDGLLDIFLPGGGYFDGPDKKTIRGLPNRLYRNLGGRRFEGVTEGGGVGRGPGHSHRAAGRRLRPRRRREPA